MSNRTAIAVVAVLFALSASGCAALKDIDYMALSDYRVLPGDLDPARRSENQCTLGGAYTNQGHALCSALMNIEIRKTEIVDKVQKISNQPFDLALLTLGFLSAGALAADSHDSVLKGLGILSATAIGLRGYTSSESRRSAYLAGHAGLTCISEASLHLLWDDSWFYRLRSYRRLLGESLGSLAEAAEGSADIELKRRADEIRPGALESLRLADTAVASYAGMGAMVNSKREQMLVSMRSMIDGSRGDVGEIVTSILAAESVRTAKDQEVDTAQEEISDTAAENTPTGMAASMAASEVNQIIDSQPDTVANVGDIGVRLTNIAIAAASETSGPSEAARQANAKLIAALTMVAKAMQEIAYIAPRYIKTDNAIDACVIS